MVSAEYVFPCETYLNKTVTKQLRKRPLIFLLTIWQLFFASIEFELPDDMEPSFDLYQPRFVDPKLDLLGRLDQKVQPSKFEWRNWEALWIGKVPNLSFWRQRRHRHVLKPLSSMGVAHLPTFGFFMVHGCYGKYSAQFIWFDVLVFVYVHPRYFRLSSWQVEGLCLGAPAFFRCLKHFRNQKLCAKKLEIRFK